MKFKSFYKKKYKTLVVENFQSKLEEYEDWTDFLDYEDSIPKDDIENFIQYYNLDSNYYINLYLNLKKNTYSYWLKLENETYEVVANSDERMKSYVWNMSNDDKLSDLGISEDQLYFPSWETTLGEIKKEGGTVYHYTQKDRWEKIKKSGILNPSTGASVEHGYTRGLSNRYVSGIFTSINPETFALGEYGDVMLTIDLTRFKKEENIDILNIEPEPDILEATINDLFFQSLGFEMEQQYVAPDMSPDTVIVNHAIPIKFIEVTE